MFLSRGPWGHGFGWFAFLTVTQLYCPSSQPTRGVAPAPHLLQPRFSPFPVLSTVPTTSKGENLISPFIRPLTSWILSLLWYYPFVLQHSATFVCQKDAVSNSKFPVFLTQCYIRLLIFLNLLFSCHVLKGLWALVVEGYICDIFASPGLGIWLVEFGRECSFHVCMILNSDTENFGKLHWPLLLNELLRARAWTLTALTRQAQPLVLKGPTKEMG